MQCTFNIQYFILGRLIKKRQPYANEAKNVNKDSRKPNTEPLFACFKASLCGNHSNGNQFDLQQNVRLLFICIFVYQHSLSNRRKQRLGNGLS